MMCNVYQKHFNNSAYLGKCDVAIWSLSAQAWICPSYSHTLECLPHLTLPTLGGVLLKPVYYHQVYFTQCLWTLTLATVRNLPQITNPSQIMVCHPSISIFLNAAFLSLNHLGFCSCGGNWLLLIALSIAGIDMLFFKLSLDWAHFFCDSIQNKVKSREKIYKKYKKTVPFSI